LTEIDETLPSRGHGYRGDHRVKGLVACICEKIVDVRRFNETEMQP
jgi:hypothetical protein